MSIQSKKDLELVLSKLKTFNEPSFKLEQYFTTASIAADWIWQMALKGEIAGKVILDAGCGSGILGIGLLLMGARKIYFIDKDDKVTQICIENYNSIKDEYEIGEAEFIVEDISLFDAQVDLVVQNPPFGTKDVHADKRFLEKAFLLAPIIYSMHKWTTKGFVEAICKDSSFKITDTYRYEFPIKAQFDFHKKKVENVDVGLWRMEKID